MKFHLFVTLTLLCSFFPVSAQQDSILLFVSQSETYYSEYVVMKEALTAEGYYVDVRSASTADASSYTIGGDLQAQANGLSGSDYNGFLDQYQALYGQAWNNALNTVPATIPVNGSILDVTSMEGYKGLVLAGGIGVVAYRIDGSYASQGALSAQDVQNTAEKLNFLALDALQKGKPVLAQCHGASLAPFWRLPETSGGYLGLGMSVLEGSIATGYPETATGAYMDSLNVTYRAEDKVVIGNPNSNFIDNGYGDWKLLTSRDWYPQTVAHAAKVFINVIRTYPPTPILPKAIKVLVVHGGPVVCGGAGNDVPCNHGSSGVNIPADYQTIIHLLDTVSVNDGFKFDVDEVNLITNENNQYAFNPFNQCAILTYLAKYDVVFFFKHWSTNLSTPFEQALLEYADKGGGVVSLHHGLYDENKGAIPLSLFNAVSTTSGWSGNLYNFNIYSTNYGHFVSSFGVEYANIGSEPAIWGASNPLLPGTNFSESYYPVFSIYDEIYGNMQFTGSPSFGDGVNEIYPIFSNDAPLSAPSNLYHQHVHGFVKLVNPTLDNSVGKLVYAQSGERVTSFTLPHSYAQFVRNAIYWAGENTNVDFEDKIWSHGAGTSSWNAGTNWYGNAVPQSCHDVFVPDSGLPISIDLPGGNAAIQIQSMHLGENISLSIPGGTTLHLLKK